MNKIIIMLTAFLIIGIQPVSGQSSHNYDPDYEVNREMQGAIMNGYKLDFDLKFTTVLFCDPNAPMKRDAFYNLDKQYYGWKRPNFDSSKIDLKLLYKKIDLTKTTLDRMEPQTETVKRDTDLENKAYDYSNDLDFKDFMTYCEKIKVPADIKQFYIKAANNSAKRGKNLLQGKGTFSEAEVGINPSAFKPPMYKNMVVPYDKRDGITYLAGGMQLYFEFRKKERYVYPDMPQNIFKDNAVVPVVIVELDPAEGNTGPKILQGAALVKRAKSDLERTFHKPFKVTHKKMTISYTGFADCGKIAPLSHYSTFLEKNVDIKLPKNTIIIYYFTDSKRLMAIDDEMTHPVSRGPYGTDWGRIGITIIHEMGHTLQLMHHFNNTEGSSDLANHISPACIMNYKYKSADFCPLCRYGLGVDR